jgi:hypothetical protein
MDVRIRAAVVAVSGGLALGACSMLPDSDSFRMPDTSTMFRVMQVTSFRDKPLAPITPEELVDGQGNCAGVAAPAAGSDGQPTGADAPLVVSSVALEMSECEVVRRVGVPQQVDIGAEPSGERGATLTYTVGARPGIYRFVGGRLRTMERGPEPPEPKVVKKPAKKPAKKKAAAG